MAQFVVVLPLTPLAAGAGFATADWPLHVTLLPPFAIEVDAAAVAARLGRALLPPGPITAVAADDAWFGRRHSTLVTLLEPLPALVRLHERAVDAVSGLGARFRTPEHLRSGYRPHVTAQRAGKVASGALLRLDQLALIDLQPRKGEPARVVRATIPLAAP